MQTPFGFSQHLRQRLTLRLAALLSLIAISILSLLVAAIWKARHDAIAKARLEASYISAALDDDVEGVLNTLACVSRFVNERLDTDSKDKLLPNLYDRIHQDAPALASIALVGPDGMLVAKSDNRDWGISDFSGFEFFQSQRLGSGNAFQIGKPLTILDRVIVPASRRVETKDGGFGGVAMFVIDPAMGGATYRKVHLGDTGSIKVIGTDGTVFAGYA